MTDDLVKRLRELDRLHSYADKCEAASRIEKLEKQVHYANGVADLAMKHRDYAEQRVEKLEAALAHIYAWYPISVSEPLQTIKEISIYARKALEGKDD